MELDKLVKKVKNMRDLSEMLVGSVMVTRMDGDFASSIKSRANIQQVFIIKMA